MRLLALALLLLPGCVQTRLHAEQPAVLAADAASAEALSKALQEALGRPVVLASDALTRESTLVIENTPAKVDGARIDGRDTRPPERFTLLLSGGDCVLQRDATGERIALPGARCSAATPAPAN